MAPSSLHILLIESNRGDRRWVRESLHWAEMIGICPSYYIHQCDRLEQGLERLQEGDCHVILLDLDLPENHGMEAVKSLNLANPDIPILVMTARVDDEIGLEAIRHGAQDFLVKGHTDKRHLARSVVFAVERNRMLDKVKRSEAGWNSILAKLRDMGTGRGVARLTREFVHEFNNLLSVLQGYALLLKKNLKEGEQEIAWINKIVDSLKRGTELTSALQAFSASTNTDSESTDINELLVRVYESLRTFTGQKHTSELNFSQIPPVHVASRELEGTLLALLLFAPDLKKGGKILKWKTRQVYLTREDIGSYPWYFPPGEYVEINMEIPGMVLNQELVSGLQDPITALSSENAELLLILSSLLDSVKKDRGHLILRGAQGRKDPQMSLYFPIEPELLRTEEQPLGKEPDQTPTADHPEVETSSMEETEIQVGELEGEGHGILLVDDEPELLYLLGMDLKELGFEIFTATSGKESFDLLEKNHQQISLAILDLKMPEMSGEEVYHWINLNYPDLPVFILTGYGEDRIIQDLLNCGVKGVLSKPYDLKELMNLCRPYLPDSVEEEDDWSGFYKSQK